MLKTTSAVGSAVSAEVRDKKQDGKGIQVGNWDEKEPAQPVQKSRKGQSKGQKRLSSKSGSE